MNLCYHPIEDIYSSCIFHPWNEDWTERPLYFWISSAQFKIWNTPKTWKMSSQLHYDIFLPSYTPLNVLSIYPTGISSLYAVYIFLLYIYIFFNRTSLLGPLPYFTVLSKIIFLTVTTFHGFVIMYLFLAYFYYLQCGHTCCNLHQAHPLYYSWPPPPGCTWLEQCRTRWRSVPRSVMVISVDCCRVGWILQDDEVRFWRIWDLDDVKDKPSQMVYDCNLRTLIGHHPSWRLIVLQPVIGQCTVCPLHHLHPSVFMSVWDILNSSAHFLYGKTTSGGTQNLYIGKVEMARGYNYRHHCFVRSGSFCYII